MHDREDSDEDRSYREIIDNLVRECRSGQGHIVPKAVREGVWNPEQHDINGLLNRTSAADREVIARMLQEAFEGGVHQTLVAIHEARLAPFDKGYEGTPFHDFIGRLNDWEWPKSGSRS
jgi:hypothetical protein